MTVDAVKRVADELGVVASTGMRRKLQNYPDAPRERHHRPLQHTLTRYLHDCTTAPKPTLRGQTCVMAERCQLATLPNFGFRLRLASKVAFPNS
eukprot:2127474-Amphidinium_carterae.1